MAFVSARVSRIFCCIGVCIASLIRVACAEERGPVTLDFAPLGAHAAAAASAANAAPMDESFGHYPMSVFGIATAIHKYDGTRRLDDGPIAYAIVAIRDWEHRFPNDPWIARELLAMQRVYEHAHTAEGDTYARDVATWLQNDYPETSFASSSRNDLAKHDERPEESSHTKAASERAEETPAPRPSARPASYHTARPASAPQTAVPAPTSAPDGEPTIPSYARPQ